jgi:GDP/UDP-N,N'-diacetylbacillosamine 2-epimerase (hydrolysing)
MKKICIVTVSRADWGLLRWVAHEVSQSAELQLQIVSAGAHFSPEQGDTHQEIINDGFTIDARIDITPRETSPGFLLESLGGALSEFSSVFDTLTPDLVVLLGDRSETLLAAYAATIYGIPLAHIHGGEITEGAIDDALRHAVTKLSHLHFVSHDKYKDRVIQMGEMPDRVYVTKPLGHESIAKINRLARVDLEHSLGIVFAERNLLITLHPETLHPERNEQLVSATLDALARRSDTGMIFTASNTDVGGDAINAAVRDFCSARPNAWFCESLGTRMYVSVMAQVNAVVGNSSSGLLEAPALGIPTINIGSRQAGRLRESTVVDVVAGALDISMALDNVLHPESHITERIIRRRTKEKFPSQIIRDVLVSSRFETLRDKTFHDLTWTQGPN